MPPLAHTTRRLSNVAGVESCLKKSLHYQKTKDEARTLRPIQVTSGPAGAACNKSGVPVGVLFNTNVELLSLLKNDVGSHAPGAPRLMGATSMASYTERAFFKEAIIYQVYPASFCDSNDDGFGDLKGIQSKLGYLQSLGVDVIWINPVYKSPMKDMGYDIADYKAISERYGSLKDWDELASDLHSRGMKIMMDLVLNHTSDEHEWFRASRSSKINNPKRDWYHWRPPKYGKDGTRQPPNNWASVFSGSAWEWDEQTQEYYLHLFDPGQPDLNWSNPEVREVIWEMMLWWLARGTDGFRMGGINLISKTAGLPDASVINPTSPWQPGHAHFVNGPDVHQYLQEMRQRVFSEYPAAITVGEISWTYDPYTTLRYVYPSTKELHMVFQNELGNLVWFTLPSFKRLITKWQKFMHMHGGWSSACFENHDLARSVSRFLGFAAEEPDGPNKSNYNSMRMRAAKLLCIQQVTQGGTLYIYQGQELGMANVPKTWGIEDYKDVLTINSYNRILNQRSKVTAKPDMSDVLAGLSMKARDNARTPVQWDASPHAGFTSASANPWMRVNSDYKTWNAAAQVGDPMSVHTFWKNAISARKANPVLTYGDFVPFSEEHRQIFAYTRSFEDVTALVVLNFSPEHLQYAVSIPGNSRGARLLLVNTESNSDKGIVNLSDVKLNLGPYEGRVYITGKT